MNIFRQMLASITYFMTDLPEWLSEKMNLRLSRKNIIIPESIHIQLVDQSGTNVQLENVLCSLHIMIDDASYYTCGFLATDHNGSVNLGKEVIIEKSQLKQFYDPTLPIAGKEVIPLIYSNAKDFKNGIAEVMVEGKWIKIDKKGNHIYLKKYND